MSLLEGEYMKSTPLAHRFCAALIKSGSGLSDTNTLLETKGKRPILIDEMFKPLRNLSTDAEIRCRAGEAFANPEPCVLIRQHSTL